MSRKVAIIGAGYVGLPLCLVVVGGPRHEADTERSGDHSDGSPRSREAHAEPSGYATSDDGRYGFFVMDNQKYLETLHFDTLLYDEVRIPSAPVYLGVLPGSATAWVSQQHDLGRISFYDPDGGALDTLTGFELNAGIEH